MSNYFDHLLGLSCRVAMSYLLIGKFVVLCAECGEWYILDEPKVQRIIARFGHSAVVHDNKMYIFGGFNGIVLDNIFVYQPGESCSGVICDYGCVLDTGVWAGVDASLQ